MLESLVDHIEPYIYTDPMPSSARATKKITVNIPEEALEHAMRITQKGITETLVEGLREIQRREQRSALRKLKGKIRFSLDLEGTRR